MPSVKQVIAEIQLAPDLPPSHKAKAVQIIRDAEERLKLKRTTQARKISNAKGLMTLEKWERINGGWMLRDGINLAEWVTKKKLDYLTVCNMLDEFRSDMLAKGKQYADFKMAFQNYLRKGWLSKTMAQCVRKEATHVDRKGVTL